MMVSKKSKVRNWAIISNDTVINIVEWDGLNGGEVFPDVDFYEIRPGEIVGVGYSCNKNSNGAYEFFPPENYNTML